MKRRSICLAVIALVMSFVVANLVIPSPTKAADAVVWRWVNMMPASHFSSVLHIEMAKEVEKATNGGFKIMFYPGDMLMTSRDATQATLKGTISLDSAGSQYLEGVVPVLGGDALPFGGVSDEDWQKMLTGQGPLRKFSVDNLEKYGVLVLSRWVHGNNGLISRKPVLKIADWKGVKMRLFPLDLAIGKALGAEVVVMTGDEAVDATRRGVLEASMANAGAAEARGYGEFCKFYIEWPLGMQQVTLITSKKLFDGLSPEYQKVLKEAVIKYEVKLWEVYYKDRDSAYSRLEKQGVKVVLPTKDDLKKFADVAKPINAGWADKFGARGHELLDMVAKYQGK